MKTCPYCGKKYADAVRPEKQLKECPFCETNFETGLPPKPKFGIDRIVCIMVGVALIVPTFIWSDVALSSGIWLFALMGIVICFLTIKSYVVRKNLHDYAQYNPKEYARQVTERREKDESRTQREIAERKERLARLPACPICGSKEYVERITNADRSVEVAVWGLGASSVGKQFECRKCRHAFNADSPTPAVAEDPVEELRRCKLLLDEGIITQDEFDEKKKQVLGL